MKSYEDITERVFQKGDEILKRKHKRTVIIKRTSLAVSGICAAVLICFGVWRNDDIKDSVNNFHNRTDIITENNDIRESTTGFSQQTSFYETSATSAPFINTAPVSTMTTQAVTSGNKTFSGNTVICTTVPNPIYSVDTTKEKTEHTEKITQKTEYLHETTLTTLSTAVQTNPTQTITDVLTQTTTTSVEENEEGGIYMKKLTSFFTSAIILAGSVSPIVGHAEFKVDTGRYWAGERDIFAAMDSGELETDIDGNGVVDAIDGYILESYTFAKRYSVEQIKVSDEIVSRIESIADYNGDGEVNDDDAESWVRHFIVGGNLNAELFNYDYYSSEYISIDSEEYLSRAKGCIVGDLRSNMGYLCAGYYLVTDMCDKGIINLDANGNGQLDIGDAYDWFVYENAGRAVIAAPYIQLVQVDNVYIPEEEWNYCDDTFRTYATFISKSPSAYVGISYGEFVEYAMQFIIGNIELKPEYFTEEYYKETYGEKYFLPKYGGCISSSVKKAAGSLGLRVADDAWTKFNKDDLNDFFNSYCEDVENGIRPAPDVNMDGVVDYNDYFASNIYFSDLIKEVKANESILPLKIWKNIAQNCDFNGNGTSKDIYDILTVQLYVVKYADAIDDFDEAYDRYVESLGGTSETVTSEISYENNVKILASFDESKIVYGDANEDGVIDIADATAVLQHISNKDAHALSEQGEKNADCYNTGDGVTGMDVAAIQMLEANMIESLPINE